MNRLLPLALLLCGCGDNQFDAPDATQPPPTIDATADARPPVRRKLVVIFGQSNAGSRGLVSELELADQNLATPYPAVPYIAETGDDANPPHTNTWPLDALGPRLDAFGIARFGIELTLGRTLDAAEPGGWALAKFAFGSTALGGEWNPLGPYPTGQPNLFTQGISFVKAAMVATDSDLGALIWIQGESDAPTVPVGQLYGIRLAEFIGAERFELGLPEVLFVYGRLNITNTSPGAAGVRSGQEANQAPLAIMVDQDPFPLQRDMLHYSTQGLVDLGRTYAEAILQTRKGM